MPATFTHTFDTPVFKGDVSFSTGLFIDGKFVDGVDNGTLDVFNPSTGKLLTKISEGTSKDVDLAVKAAHRAFETTWGLNAPGTLRSSLMHKLADLMEKNADLLAALEALDNGKTFQEARSFDVAQAIETLRYYAGWADKIQGSVIETSEAKLCYTRHEPLGVVGQIIPWNFPLLMISWKLGPALATGNTIVLKPAELTPLTALFTAQLFNEAGFPAGVLNIVNGHGRTVGTAISEHMKIEKVAFTGSTGVGRIIMEAAARSNLKEVTLELGGKNPSIIFDDCDLEQAVNWSSHGVFFNQGQACASGSRIFVHAKIYDEFVARFTARCKTLAVGSPFDAASVQGPQVSEGHFNRILQYIESGKQEGATLRLGGARLGTEGYFIQPTVFTDVKPEMTIAREEIFGPVAVFIKFDDDDDIVRVANDSVFGLAAAVFSKDIDRAITTAHKLQAGTVWVNCVTFLHPGVPYGGFKTSGIGRELGEYALKNYTAVKAVQVNLGIKM